MHGPLGSRKLTPRLRAELEIATAIARERLLEAHVAHLLELIHTVGGQLSPTRTIAIYTRLHSVDPETARMIEGKTLAALGERREAAGAIQLDTTPAGGESWDSPLSLFAQIRMRLRGRVNLELRQQVEFHTGRTQVAFLQVHVNNALRFVKILAPEAPIARAVELYTEVVEVRKSVAEIVYFLTLERLSGPAPAWPDREPVRIAAPAPTSAPPVRIANKPR
jgi:hypothetical protein